MPKQTKSTVAAESIVAKAVPIEQAAKATPIEQAAKAAPVEALVSSSAPVEQAAPARKPRAKKLKALAAEAAAYHILLHAKRPSTDYLYFCDEVRPQIYREHPEFNFTQVGQEQGRRWKALPVEVRAMYKARWEADKKRYEEEKAKVEQARIDNPELFKQIDAQKKKKGRRAVKSPVKRACSAFILYCKEHRLTVKKQNPNLSFTETGRLLGTQWKELPEAQKAKYEQQAKIDNERYYEEKRNLELAAQSSPPAEPVEKKTRKPRTPKSAEPVASGAGVEAKEKKPRKPRATAETPAPVAAAPAVAPVAAAPVAAASVAAASVAAASVAAASAPEGPKKRGPKPKSADPSKSVAPAKAQ